MQLTQFSHILVVRHTVLTAVEHLKTISFCYISAYMEDRTKNYDPVRAHYRPTPFFLSHNDKKHGLNTALLQTLTVTNFLKKFQIENYTWLSN